MPLTKEQLHLRQVLYNDAVRNGMFQAKPPKDFNDFSRRFDTVSDYADRVFDNYKADGGYLGDSADDFRRKIGAPTARQIHVRAVAQRLAKKDKRQPGWDYGGRALAEGMRQTAARVNGNTPNPSPPVPYRQSSMEAIDAIGAMPKPTRKERQAYSKAGRQAAQGASQEYNRQNTPIIRDQNNNPLIGSKTEGQFEDEQNAKLQKDLQGTSQAIVDQMAAQREQQGLEQFNQPGNPFNSAGSMLSAQKRYNEITNPDALWKLLDNDDVRDRIAQNFVYGNDEDGNPVFSDTVTNGARERGISPQEYIQYYGMPAVAASLANAFENNLNKQYSVKSYADYLARKFGDSLIGTMGSMAATTRSQRQRVEQATGEYEQNLSAWGKAGGTVANLTAQALEMAATGLGGGALVKGGAKLTGSLVSRVAPRLGSLIANGGNTMLRAASENVAEKLGRWGLRAGYGMANGVAGMSGFMAEDAMRREISTGDDPSFASIAKAGWEGAKEGAKTGVLFGAAGMPGRYLTGLAGKVSNTALRTAALTSARTFSVASEAGVMTGQEYAEWAKQPHKEGERFDLSGSVINSLAMVATFKGQHLVQQYFPALHARVEAYNKANPAHKVNAFQMMGADFVNLFSGKNTSSPVRLSKDDRATVEQATGKTIEELGASPENLMEVFGNTRIPWVLRQKISLGTTRAMDVARPRTQTFDVDYKNPRWNVLTEYDKDGNPIEEHHFYTEPERDAIIGNIQMRRDNDDMLSYIGMYRSGLFHDPYADRDVQEKVFKDTVNEMGFDYDRMQADESYANYVLSEVNGSRKADFEKIRDRRNSEYPTRDVEIITQFANANDTSPEEINRIIQKDPVERSEDEQALMSSLTRTLHDDLFRQGELHVNQSMQDGADTADRLDIGDPQSFSVPFSQLSQAEKTSTDAWNDAYAKIHGLKEIVDSQGEDATPDMVADAIRQSDLSDTQKAAAIYAYSNLNNAAAAKNGFVNQVGNRIHSQVSMETMRNKATATSKIEDKDGNSLADNLLTVTLGENNPDGSPVTYYIKSSTGVRFREDGSVDAGNSDPHAMVVLIDTDGNTITKGANDPSLRLLGMESPDDFASRRTQELQMGFSKAFQQGEVPRQPAAGSEEAPAAGGNGEHGSVSGGSDAAGEASVYSDNPLLEKYAKLLPESTRALLAKMEKGDKRDRYIRHVIETSDDRDMVQAFHKEQSVEIAKTHQNGNLAERINAEMTFDSPGLSWEPSLSDTSKTLTSDVPRFLLASKERAEKVARILSDFGYEAAHVEMSDAQYTGKGGRHHYYEAIGYKPKSSGSAPKWGSVYQWAKNKVRQAVNFLSNSKSGLLKGVFHRDEIGDIGLGWGEAPTDDKGFGLAHIIRKHIRKLGDFKNIDELAAKMEDVINNGTVRQDSPTSYAIEKDNYRVVVVKDENGNWVLTAYDYVKPQSGKDTAATVTPGQSQVGAGAVAPNPPDGKDTQTFAIIDDNGVKKMKMPSGTLVRVNSTGYPYYSEATPEDAAAELLNRYKDKPDRISGLVEANIKDYQKKLEKAKKVKPSENPIPEERDKEEDAREKAINDAQSRLDHWNNIKSEVARLRTAQAEAEKAEQQRRFAISALDNALKQAKDLGIDTSSFEGEISRAGSGSATAEQIDELRHTVEEAIAKENERRAVAADLEGIPDWTLEKPSDSRKHGFRNVNGVKVTRQGETEGVYGKENKVKFSTKDTVTTRLKVIEADNVQPSHVGGNPNPSFFITEAQPKNRTDAASTLAAQEIAQNVTPSEIIGGLSEGGDNAYLSSAPTVNKRGEVIQGNNRSAALKLMYDAYKESAEKYRLYIIEHAKELGFTPEQVEQIKKMRKPVLVNEADVADKRAIELGLLKAKDLESGGEERIDPTTTARKLGDKMTNLADMLLSTTEEDMSVNDLLEQNGAKAVKWLESNGYVSATALKTAVGKDGRLTAAGKADLIDLLKHSLFEGGNANLQTMFEALPAKAQRAILATYSRDFASPESERVIDYIRDAIELWHEASHTSDAFANAKNYDDARKAIRNYTNQMHLGQTKLPSEKYSSFAIDLASRFQGMRQKEIQKMLADTFDLIQGTGTRDMFDNAGSEKLSAADAVRRIFGVGLNPEYAPRRRRIQNNMAAAIVDDFRNNGIEASASAEEGQKALEEAEKNGERIKKVMTSALKTAENTIRGWLKDGKFGKKFTIELPFATQRMVNKALGRTIDSHNITSDGLRHALKGHGEGGAKVKEGSLPLTKDDLALAPYIMTAPDRVEKGSTDITNRESVRFVKTLSNGTVVVVEKELKNSPDDMETITMWAELSPGARNARLSTSLTHTSETAIPGTDAAKIRKDAETAIQNDVNYRKMQVYHGSANDFDVFDTMNHLGEGEGSQVFGAGTYVADQKGLGEKYARIAMPFILTIDGKEYRINRHGGSVGGLSQAQNLAIEYLEEAHRGYNPSKSDSERAAAELERWIEIYGDSYKEPASVYKEALALVRSGKVSIKDGDRVLYTVDIPDDNGENYLDWDAPVTSKQAWDIADALYKEVLANDEDGAYSSEQARKALRQEIDQIKPYDHVQGTKRTRIASTIGDVYGAISTYLGSDKAASEFLHKLGYTGIKVHAAYNSGDARYKDNYNYVVFDDKDLKINGKVKFFRTASGEVYGFVTRDGKMYLDPRHLDPSLPIHEYGHLWAAAVRIKDPKRWEKIVRTINDAAESQLKPLFDEVRKDDPSLTGDDLAEEVLMRYSGKKGMKLLDDAAKEIWDSGKTTDEKQIAKSAIEKVVGNLKNAIHEFWQNVADMLGIRYRNVDDIADHLIYDALSARNPKDFKEAERKDTYEEHEKNIQQNIVYGIADRFQKEGVAAVDVTEQGGQDVIDNDPNSIVAYHKVSSDEQKRLDSESTVKFYRSMVLIDGKLYPPMSVREGRGKTSPMREPTEIGVWERSDENPERAKNGKFPLTKEDGSVVPAAYNPYFHASSVVLNDQFSTAYKRPNLVVVEVEVPKSELTSGYHAEGAKDAVGVMDWHTGPVAKNLPEGNKRKVMLSRYMKVTRILPDSEVAEKYIEAFKGKKFSVPDNTVTPSLRAELEKRGVEIVHTDTVREYEDSRKAIESANNLRSGLEAIRRITAGEDFVEDAMHRDDLSQYGGTDSVSFYWGKAGNAEKDFKGGFGLSHVGAKHGKDTLLHLLDVIANGEIDRYVEGNKTVVLSKDGYECVLALTRNGNKETWLLTGWKKNGKAGENGEVSAQSEPTQSNPTFSRTDLGAAFSKANIAKFFGSGISDILKNHKGAKFFRTASGEVYGFVTRDGKMYLDPKHLDPSLPIHEYGHLWAAAVRQKDPERWKNIVEVISKEAEGTLKPLFDEVRKDDPSLSGDDLAEEVLMRYSGKRGMERLDAEARKIWDSGKTTDEKRVAAQAIDNVKNALRSFWEKVADILGFKYKDKDQIADHIIYDALSAKKPVIYRESRDSMTSNKAIAALTDSYRTIKRNIEALYGEQREKARDELALVTTKLLGLGIKPEDIPQLSKVSELTQEEMSTFDDEEKKAYHDIYTGLEESAENYNSKDIERAILINETKLQREKDPKQRLVLQHRNEIYRAEQRRRGAYAAKYGIKNGRTTLDNIVRLFGDLNMDSSLTPVFERVVNVCRMFSPEIKFTKGLGNGVSGNTAPDGIVKYNLDIFLQSGVSNQDKASTLIHELVHNATLYALDAYAMRDSDDIGINGSTGRQMWNKLSRGQQKAVEEIYGIYEKIKNDREAFPNAKRKNGKQYGLTDVYEMVAEIYANGEFREQAKKKNLWAQLKDAIVRFFTGAEPGAEQTTVIKALAERIDYLLEHPNIEVYRDMKGHWRSRRNDTTRDNFSPTKADFDLTRDRAVRENGIVMPGLKDKMVRIVDVPRHPFKGTGHDAITKARAWASENLAGEHVAHKGSDDEFRYTIDGEDIRKYLSESSTKNSDNLGVHIAALTRLPQIIDNSIDAEIHPDYVKGNNDTRTEAEGIGDANMLVHRLYGAISIDGNVYRVKTTMYEKWGEKNEPHDYRVKKVELTISGPATGDALDSSTDNISATKLLKDVRKSYDRGKNLLSESEKISLQDNAPSHNLFIGERGARSADLAEERSTRIDNLAVARQMEAAGKDPKAIKLATGWERGADHKWRYEVPDADMDMSKIDFDDADYRSGRYFRLPELLSGDYAGELFKAYPELKDVRVKVVKRTDDYYGNYEPVNNMIALNHACSGDELHNTLLHEVQHAIQHLEGFAKGGSSTNVRSRVQKEIDRLAELTGNNRTVLEAYRKANVALSGAEIGRGWLVRPRSFLRDGTHFAYSGTEQELIAKGLELAVDRLGKAMHVAIEAYDDLQSPELYDQLRESASLLWDVSYNIDHGLVDAKEQYLRPEVYDAITRILNTYQKRVRGDIRESTGERSNKGALEAFLQPIEREDMLRSLLDKYSDYGLYKALAGEVESRNVESRQDMTPDERRASLAADTEDVSREDQILLFGDGESLSAKPHKKSTRLDKDYKGFTQKEFDDFVTKNIGKSVDGEENVSKFLSAIKYDSEAEPQEIPFTKENYDKVLGKGVDTPIGHVKMSDNQAQKMSDLERQSFIAFTKATLENPSFILSVPSEAKNGQQTERPASYVFVKTFRNNDGSYATYYNAVSVKKDGLEVVVSSYMPRESRVKAELRGGRLVHVKKVALPSEADTAVQGNQTAIPVGGSSSAKVGNFSDKRNNIPGNISNIPDELRDHFDMNSYRAFTHTYGREGRVVYADALQRPSIPDTVARRENILKEKYKDTNSHDLFVSLKNKQGTDYYDTVTEITRRLVTGSARLGGYMESSDLGLQSYFHIAGTIIANDRARSHKMAANGSNAEGEGGNGQVGSVEALVLEPTSLNRMEPRRLYSDEETEREISERITQWAKSNGCLYSRRKLKEKFHLGKQLVGGGETELYITDDGKSVIKIIASHGLYDTEYGGTRAKLEELALENSTVGNDKREVVGYLKGKDLSEGFGDTETAVGIIVRQPYVEGETLDKIFHDTDKSEPFTDKLMDSLGFEKVGVPLRGAEEYTITAYKKDGFVISDVDNPRNIIIDKDGIAHIIDCDAQILPNDDRFELADNAPSHNDEAYDETSTNFHDILLSLQHEGETKTENYGEETRQENRQGLGEGVRPAGTSNRSVETVLRGRPADRTDGNADGGRVLQGGTERERKEIEKKGSDYLNEYDYLAGHIKQSYSKLDSTQLAFKAAQFTFKYRQNMANGNDYAAQSDAAIVTLANQELRKRNEDSSYSNLNIKEGGNDRGYIFKTFKDKVKDPALNTIFDKAVAIANRLGLSIEGVDRIDTPSGGIGWGYQDASTGKISINRTIFNSEYIPDQVKMEILLHEMIHTATRYALEISRNEEMFAQKGISLSSGMKEAVSQINEVYDIISKDSSLRQSYGITDAREMLAEAGSNKGFRSKLKEVGLWTKLINGIKRFFGIKTDGATKDNALRVLDEKLNYLLDNFDEDAYRAATSSEEKAFMDAPSHNNEVPYDAAPQRPPIPEEIAKRENILKEKYKDTNSHDLFVSLKNKQGTDYYDTVTEIARRITRGEATLDRLGEEIETKAGRYETLPALVGRVIASGNPLLAGAAPTQTGVHGVDEPGRNGKGAGSGEEVLSIFGRTASQIEQWARLNGCYFDESEIEKNSLDGKMWKDGCESYVYRSKDGKSVIKVTNFQPWAWGNDIMHRLDQIQAHNAIFPNEHIEVIGYGKNRDGNFSVITRQPLIKGKTIWEAVNGNTSPDDATEAQKNKAYAATETALAALGFGKEVPWFGDPEIPCNTNGKFTLFDANNYGNIIVDSKGNYHVIDCEVLPVGYEKLDRFDISDNAPSHDNEAFDGENSSNSPARRADMHDILLSLQHEQEERTTNDRTADKVSGGLPGQELSDVIGGYRHPLAGSGKGTVRSFREAEQREITRRAGAILADKKAVAPTQKLLHSLETKDIFLKVARSLAAYRQSMAEGNEANANAYAAIIELANQELGSRNENLEASNLNIPKGEVDKDSLFKTFKQKVKDTALNALFDKVTNIVNQLGIKFYADDRIVTDDGRLAFGVQDLSDGRVTLNRTVFNSEYISDQGKMETLLHEMIHTATRYALTIDSRREMFANAGIRLSDGMTEAIRQIREVYEAVKDNPELAGTVGKKNVEEFLADMGKQNFRTRLKNIGLWQKLVNGIKHFFGIEEKGADKVNAYDKVDKLLNYILDNFDNDAYGQITEIFKLVNPNGRKAYETSNNDLPSGIDQHAYLNHRVQRDGLDRTLGHDNYLSLMRDIYTHMSSQGMRDYVRENLWHNNLDLYKTVGGYLAEQATKPGNVPMWQDYQSKVNAALHKAGYSMELGLRQAKYLAWLAQHPSDPANPLAEAERVSVRRLIMSERILQPVADGEFQDFEDSRPVGGGSVAGNPQGSVSDRLRSETSGSATVDNAVRPAAHSLSFGEGRGEAEMTDQEVRHQVRRDEFQDKFSTPGAPLPPTSTPTQHFAKAEYESRLDRTGYIWKEAHIDYMQSAQELTRAILGTDDLKGKLKDSENFLDGENQLSSRQDAMGKLFKNAVMRPLDKAVQAVLGNMGKGKSKDKMRRLQVSMIAKSGLERNRVLFMRDYIRDLRKSDKKQAEQVESDFLAAKNSLDKDIDNGVISLDEYFRQLDNAISTVTGKKFDVTKHDRSGLTALYKNGKGSYDDAKAIKDVMDFEDMVGGDLIKELWGRTKTAADYNIDMQLEGGLINEGLANHVKDEFKWYVPMRDFDEKMAEDVYPYQLYTNVLGTKVAPLVKSADGRTSLSNVDIFAQIGQMASDAISKSLQNQMVNQRFLNFIHNYYNVDGKNRLVAEVRHWIEFKGVDAGGKDVWEEAFPEIGDETNPQKVAQIVEDFNNDMELKKKNGKAKIVNDKNTIPYRFKQRKDLSHHIVIAYQNGQKHVLVVNGNPRAAEAINGILRPEGSKSVFIKTVRLMSQMVTTYSPDFMFRNTLRDFWYSRANVFANEGFKYTRRFIGNYHKIWSADFLKGGSFFYKWRKGTLDMGDTDQRLFKEFMDNGGVTGWAGREDIEKWQKEIMSDIKSGKAEALKKGVAGIGKALEMANEHAENLARFATYMTSRKMGRSMTRSIADAKEVSVNFNRKGAGKKSADFKTPSTGKATRNTMLAAMTAQYCRNNIMFYNAGMQGLNQTVKNFRGHPVRSGAAFLSFALGGFLIPLLNRAVFGDDDNEYSQLPEYLRRQNICIRAGKDNFVTIPLPIELRAVYGLGDILASKTTNPELDSGNNVALDIMSQFSQMSPLDFLGEGSGDITPGNFLMAVIPAYAKPFLEAGVPNVLYPKGNGLTEGLNAKWNGMPVRRERTPYNQNQPAWMRAFNSTGDFYMNLAKDLDRATSRSHDEGQKGFVDIDPAQLQHYVQSYTGGIGTTAGNLAQLVNDLEADPSLKTLVSSRHTPMLRTLHYTPTDQNKYYMTRSKWFNYKEKSEKFDTDLKALQSDRANPVRMAKAKDMEQSKEGEMNRQMKNALKRYRNFTKVINATDNEETRQNLSRQRDQLMEQTVNDLDMLK